MRIVFMGTPSFAVPSLEALARKHDVALVFTQPDAVRGRGRVQVPSEVKERSFGLGLPVMDAARLGDEAYEAICAVSPDVICVAAYGCILPGRVLEAAPYGCVNVHASI